MLTVSGLAKVAIFTTNVDAENQTLINHKCVCGALNRHFCQTRVCALHEQSTPIRSFIKTSNMQINGE
jgi:NADPH-dependent 7-cyano-7-deazaguanine reductase QueF-like protein